MMRAQHGMVLVGLMLVSAFGAQAGVTVESLWNEMTDLEGLTQFPAPAYVCKQFSSYDRRSTDPEVKTDENWFANGDRGQHLRVEERNGAEEWVLMDADGPGAIVRFWSANPSDAGIVRVYIDGVEEPVLELPLTSMLGGGGMPFVKPISGERSRGWNSYLPIPYARHCKVTTSKRDFYYQVNCRTYEPGTQVESFSLETASAHEELIERIAARLARPGHFRMPPDAKTVHLDADLAPGKEGVVDVGEPGAFYRATVHVEAEDMDAALRGCLLEITFDEAEEPAVLTPLGDFFGAAPGLNTYAALPCGVLADGTMYAHWVMPFARSAEVRVVNHSGRQVGVSVSLLVGAYAWTDRSMYFHAAWRGEYPLATQPRQDWTYVQVDGKGVYVGDMLHITNPVKQWWGEGDEKIYIDGEDFPSHFGTGTEDYYGYAWCCNEPFEHAYHNQPRCDGPGNYGQTSVNRFHIIDAIPFTTSFRFDMEVWHWAVCEIAMAATSYWYAMPGSTDSAERPAEEDLKVIVPEPLPLPKKVEGALEAEELKGVLQTGGNVQTQSSDTWGWSNQQQLWWTDAAVGDELKLQFTVGRAWRYDVRAAFTKAPDYGIVEFAINERPVGKQYDFYHPEVAVTDEMSLGMFDLRPGRNELTIRVVGTNPKALPKYMFGLDYILLKEASK